MKHGPLALVDEHMPVLAVATCDAMWGKMQSVIAQLLARKSQLIVMCNEGDGVTKELCAAHGCQVIEVGVTRRYIAVVTLQCCHMLADCFHQVRSSFWQPQAFMQACRAALAPFALSFVPLHQRCLLHSPSSYHCPDML